jgi:hypothetical protein
VSHPSGLPLGNPNLIATTPYRLCRWIDSVTPGGTSSGGAVTYAATGRPVVGVSQPSGRVSTERIEQVEAGGVVTVGDLVASDSVGRAVTTTGADAVGTALQAGVLGSLVWVRLDVPYAPPVEPAIPTLTGTQILSGLNVTVSGNIYTGTITVQRIGNPLIPVGALFTLSKTGGGLFSPGIKAFLIQEFGGSQPLTPYVSALNSGSGLDVSCRGTSNSGGANSFNHVFHYIATYL